METKKKTITKEITVFVAQDGTEFADHFDCLDYERELAISKLTLFTVHNGELVTASNLEDAYFIVIKTDDDLKICRELKIDYDIPTEKGIFEFHGYSWIKIDKLFDTFTKEENESEKNKSRDRQDSENV